MSTEITIVNEKAIKSTIETRKLRVEKALKVIDTIPLVIENRDQDDAVKAWIQKYKKLESDLKDERTPITKKFDEIRSSFTNDEKMVTDAINKLSKRRDDFVKAENERIRLANLAAQNERFKKEEVIELKAKIELDLRSFVNSLIEQKKTSVLKALADVNKSNKDAKIQGLTSMPTELDPLKYGNFENNAISRYKNDVAAINKEIVLNLETELLAVYKSEIDNFKHECLMQINTLANMKAEEKKTAIEQKTVEVTVETSTANEVASVQISSQTDAAKAESAFTSIASHEDTGLPSNIQGYDIQVLNNAGWIAIIKFWIVTIAPNFDGNFETKTPKSMKGDLEKYALKTGTKLESPSLEYVVTYKAINK